MYLVISNKGELELEALRLFGASTKRSDQGKIGFFGTGNKYALSVLLRSNAEVLIFSGLKQVKIATRPAMLRGVRFDEVVIDDLPTGFTTASGPKWETWMAVRELVCNAVDEGGESFQVLERPNPRPQVTTVAISFAHVRDVWENWSRYFRFGVAPGLLPKVDAITRVYRKGILVKQDALSSSFDYECPELAITEERVAVDVRSSCWSALDASPLASKQQVLMEMRPFEASLPNHWFSASESWAEAIDGGIACTKEQVAFYGTDIKRPRILPDAWVGVLRSAGVPTVETVFRRRSHPSARSGRDVPGLASTLKRLSKFGIRIGIDEVVTVDRFEDEDQRGEYDDGRIFVLASLQGRDLVEVLIHEWAHRESGAGDRTREFEQFLCRTLAGIIDGH